MGLESRIFQGDPKLEACLVQDAAHITQDAAGPHVAKIQTVLIAVDSVAIDLGELSAKRYGQSTAAAVLSFKRKRSIINRNYQTKPDNIVGKMTIAALDKEMAEKEKESPPSGTLPGPRRPIRLFLTLPEVLDIIIKSKARSPLDQEIAQALQDLGTTEINRSNSVEDLAKKVLGALEVRKGDFIIKPDLKTIGKTIIDLLKR